MAGSFPTSRQTYWQQLFSYDEADISYHGILAATPEGRQTKPQLTIWINDCRCRFYEHLRLHMLFAS